MTTTDHREWYWGAKGAEPIHSKEYETEKDVVAKYIQMNPDNPLIQKVTADLDEWLEEVFNSKYYQYGRFLARLWDAGIRGTDILVEVSALMLFALRNKSRIINERHFIHLVGNKVIRIVPYWTDTTGPEHYGIGMDVLKHLKGAHVGVCKMLLDSQRETAKAKRAMGSPLDI